MQIGNSVYNYNIDFNTRVNAQQQATANHHGTEHDTRGLEKNEASEQTKSNPQQKDANSTQLTADERIELNKLQAIDAKVRAHEAAHQSGAAAAGGASFTYQKGADGVMYAVGGEVPVRIASGSTPHESIANAQAAITTALAPADPSPQDISVASQARVILMKAQQELAKQIQEEASNSEGFFENAIKRFEENSSSQSEDKNNGIIA